MSGAVWKHRVFTPFQILVTLALFAEASIILGVAAFPAVEIWLWIADRLPLVGAPRVLALSITGAVCYFVFGLALLVVLPIARCAGRASTRSR